MLVNVLIPIYKPQLSTMEATSLRQCLKVLGRYPITIVTHAHVDLSAYQALFLEAGLSFRSSFFDQSNFANVFSYSRMLMDQAFYSRFKEYEYLFIYQLDGYVFKDELKDWCDKGYDYIGAPWLKKYGYHYEGNEFWKVGNGGVSLRKTATFLHILEQPFPLRSIWFYVKSIRKNQLFTMFARTIKMAGTLVFTRKTVYDIVCNYTDERVNEDCFWAEAFQKTKLALNIPDIRTAAAFCFEQKPSVLYELNNRQLPFSCHAFEKYDYDSFWKNIFDSNSKKR